MKISSGIKTLWQKGLIHLIIANYSIQIIVFLSHLLIAKIMQPRYVGVVKTIETYISIAYVLGAGGMIFAILKEIPQLKDTSVRQAVLKYAFRYVLLFSATIFILYSILSHWGWLGEDPLINKWTAVYAWVIIPVTASQFLMRYYQAVHRFKRISIIIVLTKITGFVIVLSATYYFHLQGYVFGMIASAVIGLFFLVADIRSELFSGNISLLPDSVKKHLRHLAKEAFSAQVIDQIRLWGYFLLANFLIRDREAFGQFSFALILVQGLNILNSSIQQFTTPSLSEAAQDTSLFFKKMKKFEWNYIRLTAILFVLLQIFIPPLITGVFGNTYSASVPLFRILLTGWFIATLFTLKGIPFLSFGKMRYIAYSSSILVITVLPLAYFLIRKYGVEGAAWSMVIQNVILGILLVVFNRKLRKELEREKSVPDN
jgi:O-antigen/teichoic acid export membrane protein